MRTIEQIKGDAREALKVIQEDPEALARLREAVDEAQRLAPADPEVALITGWLRTREGLRSAGSKSDLEAAFAQAASEFQKAIELGLAGYSEVPLHATVALFHISHYFQTGFEEGPATVRRLLALEGLGRASRHYQKAIFMSNYGPQNERTLILSEIDRGLALDRHPKLLRFRGDIRKKTADYQGALEDFDEALGLAPHDAAILQARARLKVMLADPAGASADFAEAFKIDPPDGYDHWLQLAESYLAAGRLDLAISTYDRASKCKDSGIPLIASRRAVAKERIGDLEGAIQDLELAAKAPGLAVRATEMRRSLLRRLEQRGSPGTAG